MESDSWRRQNGLVDQERTSKGQNGGSAGTATLQPPSQTGGLQMVVRRPLSSNQQKNNIRTQQKDNNKSDIEVKTSDKKEINQLETI